MSSTTKSFADATMRLMSNVGAKLAAMPENDRPGQVIMLVFSDGHENASKEARLEHVRAAVKHQEEAYSWKFLFFGMDIDAAAGGGAIGMSRGLNVQKGGGGGGIMRGVQAASAYVGYSRLGDAKMAQRIEHASAVDDASARSATEDFADLIKSKPAK